MPLEVGEDEHGIVVGNVLADKVLLNTPAVRNGKLQIGALGIETGVLCAAANAFCKIIKDAGYDPMIYITDYAGYVKYDLSEVMDYPLWYARYDVDAPSFYYDFAMWQYSSKGSVDGIKGNVDMDIWFIK